MFKAFTVGAVPHTAARDVFWVIFFFFFDMDMLQRRKGRNQKDLAAAMLHAACTGKKPRHSKLKI